MCERVWPYEYSEKVHSERIIRASTIGDWTLERERVAQHQRMNILAVLHVKFRWKANPVNGFQGG